MFIELLFKPVFIITPAVLGGVLHSIGIRLGVLSSLTVPLSKRWFGRHKTYRGFVLMPLGCVVGVYLAAQIERLLPASYAVGFQDLTIWREGLALGFAYVLFELPNSFLKRRVGIKEGILGTGRTRWVFLAVDQVDSVIGCVLVCWLFFDVHAAVLVATFIIGVAGHMGTNLALYASGVRSRPV